MTETVSPLERFLPEYVEVAGGAWEQVEPQVYDVLLPPDVADESAGEDGVVRVTFDPEAAQEHPGAQLLLYGSPLLDRVLDHAQAQNRVTRGFLLGVNLAVQPDAHSWLHEGLGVPDGAAWEVGAVRPLLFQHAGFWFQATYLSDEKEQESYVGAIDLYHGRFARGLEERLRAGTCELSSERPFPCADAPHRPLVEAYARARQRVVATALSVGRGHQREQEERTERQVARTVRYYGDLEEELGERLARARRDGRTSPRTLESLEERRRGIGREQRVRVSELRRRSALRVSVRLRNLMLVAYPKLRIQARLSARRGPALAVPLVWDPLAARLEPPDCPACARPTRDLLQDDRGRWRCPGCGG